MIIDGILQVLDIDTGEYGEYHPSQLFEKYSAVSESSIYENFITGFHDMLRIDFKGRNMHVKIRDWTGWSELVSIDCMKDSINNGTVIKFGALIDDTLSPDGKPTCIMTVSAGSRLAVYDKNDSSMAFHGEVKYRVMEDLAKNVSSEYATSLNQRYLRHIQKYDQFLGSEELVTGIRTPQNCESYRIETKSGFYNLSGFHMLDDKIEIPGISSKIYK